MKRIKGLREVCERVQQRCEQGGTKTTLQDRADMQILLEAAAEQLDDEWTAELESNTTVIIEVRVNGKPLRLTKEAAARLWAELGEIFGLLFPDEPEPPAPPQVVPVYVPWYPTYTWPQITWGGGTAVGPQVGYRLTTSTSGELWIDANGKTVKAGER